MLIYLKLHGRWVVDWGKSDPLLDDDGDFTVDILKALGMANEVYPNGINMKKLKKEASEDNFVDPRKEAAQEFKDKLPGLFQFIGQGRDK